METLNLDSFGEIVNFLSTYDITSLASTSKHFRNISWTVVKSISVELHNEHLNYIFSRNLAAVAHLDLLSPTKLAHNVVITSEVHPLTKLTTLKSLNCNIYSGKHTEDEVFNAVVSLTRLESIKFIKRTDLAVLANHKHLTSLEWMFSTDKSLDWSSSTQLRELSILGMNFPYYGTKCLIRLLTNLKYLNISHSLVDDVGQITCLTNLEDLRMGDQHPGADVFKKLTSVLSLDIIQMKDINIDDISPMTQLTKLNFKPDSANLQFPNFSILTNIKHLGISEESIFNPVNMKISDLKQLEKIKINNPQLVHQISPDQHTNLRKLVLKTPISLRDPIPKDALTLLCTITSLKKLRIVTFAKFDSRTFYQNISQLTQLQSLSVEEIPMKECFKPEFVRFLQPLTRLTFFHTDGSLTPATAKKITALTQLIELNVRSIGKSLLNTVKSFPFRVVHTEVSSLD